MRKAFFSRVDNTTSFSSLMAEASRQMKAANKAMYYEVISQIYVPNEQFSVIMNSVGTPIPQYEPHYKYSIASPMGIWQCIEVKCVSDIRVLVVYMAGRTFPLYAAPIMHIKNQERL